MEQIEVVIHEVTQEIFLLQAGAGRRWAEQSAAQVDAGAPWPGRSF